ncbi:3-keto-5-aminohexanoate cleavage protein [Streptomyces sp. R44]|uniref:3-keto-5-aminohexanoate cleavage protein n=1 Tax=Streptomyces sp. R44 TaxID=3238633 RepID=A0AB39SWY5_9ACTN
MSAAAAVLQVCLNGSRGPRDSAAVPMTPESLAESAARSVAAGAREVRVHPRTPCGGTSLSPRVLGPVLTAIGAAVGTPVRVTTTASAEPDPGRRVERIRSWTVLPGLVSVDWHEPGAEEVATALLERGIAVEAALWSGTDGPARFASSPPASRVERVLAKVTAPAMGPDLLAKVTDLDALAKIADPDLLTEVTDPGLLAQAGGRGGDSAATARVLLPAPAVPPGVPVLLHGVDDGVWPVLRLARRLGAHARIGLEDTLFLPDGTRARSNAELVAAALAY